MGLFVLSLFCLLSLTCFGYSTNKQIICKDVGDLTNANVDTQRLVSTNKHMICRDVGDLTIADVDTQRLVSTRVKQGIKGERGLTGQPGIVDYDKVKEIVRLNVENETHPHGIKVNTMEEQIKNLTSQISETRQHWIKVDEMETKIENLMSQTSETRLLGIKVDKIEKQIQKLTSQTSENSLVWMKVNNMKTQIQNLASKTSDTLLLRTKVDNMEKQIQKLTSQTSETRILRIKVHEMETEQENLKLQILAARCVDGVIHEGKCYWAEVHSFHDTNYAEAEEICNNKMSRLADIYGKDHHEKMMSFLRGKLNRQAGMWVWTGMKKIYGNNIAQLSNGSPAPYTRQRTNRILWDDADSGRTHVWLKVSSSTSDPDQGMAATWPSADLHAALCQTE